MIINADDYGISRSVGSGIRELIRARKISSVSCMLTGDSASGELVLLKEMNPDIDVGLHLVLTNDFSLSRPSVKFPSCATLFVRCVFRQISKPELRDEILKQVQLFELHFGRRPDFIDGHQHVHQFSVIRDVLLEVYQELHLDSYIRTFRLPLGVHFRDLLSPPRWSLKEIFSLAALNVLGKALAKKLEALAIPTNDSLLGHFDYSGKKKFQEVFFFYSKFTEGSQNALFICHPGYVDQELESRDSLQEGRKDCLQFLASWEGVAPGRFARRPSSESEC